MRLELRPSVLALALLVASCATTGADGEGDKNLPTTGVGPFRKLNPEEVKGLAPYVFENRDAQFRDPAVLRDLDNRTTYLFAVADIDGKQVIVRSRAFDERTFFGSSSHFGQKPPVVLAPSELWEEFLDGPAAIRFKGEVFLYYSAAQGIGVARSTDNGLTFRKEVGPVLKRDLLQGTWETEPPHAPTVYEATDGKLHLFYQSGVAIGEAVSSDGVEWQRVRSATNAATAVLVPAPPAAPGSLLPNERPPFDTASVGDPCVVTRVTPAGRFHVRVLYTGRDATGASAIGFAARYGDSGALQRQTAPVYAVGLHEAAPALLDLGGGRSYLYVQQDRRDGNNPIFTAVAAAFAPGNELLPPAGDFPDVP